MGRERIKGERTRDRKNNMQKEWRHKKKIKEEEYLLCLQGVFKLHSSTLTFESCGVQRSRPEKKNGKCHHLEKEIVFSW